MQRCAPRGESCFQLGGAQRPCVAAVQGCRKKIPFNEQDTDTRCSLVSAQCNAQWTHCSLSLFGLGLPPASFFGFFSSKQRRLRAAAQVLNPAENEGPAWRVLTGTGNQRRRRGGRWVRGKLSLQIFAHELLIPDWNYIGANYGCLATFGV